LCLLVVPVSFPWSQLFPTSLVLCPLLLLMVLLLLLLPACWLLPRLAC
jgi:hypothetical protein